MKSEIFTLKFNNSEIDFNCFVIVCNSFVITYFYI